MQLCKMFFDDFLFASVHSSIAHKTFSFSMKDLKNKCIYAYKFCRLVSFCKSIFAQPRPDSVNFHISQRSRRYQYQTVFIDFPLLNMAESRCPRVLLPDQELRFNYNLFTGQMDMITTKGDTVQIKRIKELQLITLTNGLFFHSYKASNPYHPGYRTLSQKLALLPPELLPC